MKDVDLTKRRRFPRIKTGPLRNCRRTQLPLISEALGSPRTPENMNAPASTFVKDGALDNNPGTDLSRTPTHAVPSAAAS
jgi:hypothetical protein